jgi:capsular polysaccharide transport system permease protein
MQPYSPPSLWRSLQVQRRVIHALILREVLTRYGRHNIGFLWVFAENLLFTAAVVFFWVMTHSSNIRGLSIISFSVLGYSSVLVWRNCVNRTVKAIEPNRSLLYHKQVKIFDIYFSRILLEVIATTGSFLFVYGVMLILDLMNWPENPGLFFGGWLMLLSIAASLALLVGPWSELSELLDRVWHIMTYILFPLSGAFIVVEWLPVAAQQVLMTIPLVHAAEMIRGGYYGSIYKAHYEVAYVLACNVMFIAIGLLLMRKVENSLVME